MGWLFVLPWLISLLVFSAYPMIASIFLSLTNYNVLEPPQWIGLRNFEVMFATDPLFWKSVWNTLYYVGLSVPLQLVVALGLALLLNHGRRGIGLYRSIYYLPTLVPLVATTLLWFVLLDPRQGLVNAALGALGLPALGWLSSSDWSKPGLILISLWSGSGAPMLIFLAGLRVIPKALLEAATIDGANAAQRFRHVVLPLLTPAISLSAKIR